MYANENRQITNILTEIDAKLKVPYSSRYTDFASESYFSSKMYQTEFKGENTKITKSIQENISKNLYDTQENKKEYHSEKDVHSSEIRRILEREINPYILTIKKELKNEIDIFKEEMNDLKFLSNEINDVKSQIKDNQKLIFYNQEEFDKKVNDIYNKINIFEIKSENNVSYFENLNHQYKNIELKVEVINQIPLINDRQKNIEQKIKQSNELLEERILREISQKNKSFELKLGKIDEVKNEFQNFIQERLKNEEDTKKIINDLNDLLLFQDEKQLNIESSIEKLKEKISITKNDNQLLIDNISKNFLEKLKQTNEVIKNNKDLIEENKEEIKKNEFLSKNLSTSIEELEEKFEKIDEILRKIPKIENEISGINQHIVDLNDNNIFLAEKTKEFSKFNENLNFNIDELISLKNEETMKKFEEIEKNISQKVFNDLKDFSLKIKKYLSDFKMKNNQKNDILTDDFLISQEKKFVEINENFMIMDKNISLLLKKVEELEQNLPTIENSDENTNLDQSGKENLMVHNYNSCDIHSLKKEFILIGNTGINEKLIEKNRAKYNFFEEKQAMKHQFKSKINDIKVTINDKSKGTSKKFELNNLYIKCTPTEFVEQKANFKNYIPKYYCEKKNLINIIEVEVHDDQENNDFSRLDDVN